MQNKVNAPWALESMSERHLDVYHQGSRVEKDICDITLWLFEKYQLRLGHVWIDCHGSYSGRKISGASVNNVPMFSADLPHEAQCAFLALGYTITDSGTGVDRLLFCEGNHSRHEALRAYSRIEETLMGWRFR